MGPLPAFVPRTAQRSLALGVAWPSAWQEFRSSLRAFFAGPRAPKVGAFSGGANLTIYWVSGRMPGRALAASSLWHVAAVLVSLLPIWGFLASPPPNLAPVRIELTWYGPAQDLPPIALRGPDAKPNTPAEPRKPRIQRGADRYHPRQTILSMPLRVTHPSQTLIQPKAPATPPRVLPQLPNIVEWAATAPVPKLEPHFSQTSFTPRLTRHEVSSAVAPEIANTAKDAAPLDLAPAPATVAMPQLPVASMSAPTAARRALQEDTAAPEIGPVASAGDGSLHRLIALSADPAPPAPEVQVPAANLSARISISPEGGQPGAPGGSGHEPAGSGAEGAASAGGSRGGDATGTGGGGTLPSGEIRISGGNASEHPGGGGIVPGGIRPGGKLNLGLKPAIGAHADLSAPVHGSSRADIASMDPTMPPEKILWDKQVYTLRVDMPNMTSISGSWLLKFAQLDDGAPPYIKRPELSGPVLVRKVDPKYPPALIEAHVDGEVVLYAIIRKDGSVDSIQLVRGIDPQLDMNSIEALGRWKFRPATREGVPVDLETVVHIPFRFRPAS